MFQSITKSRKVERETIEKLMRDTVQGELLTYAQMSEAVGMNVQRVRYVMEAARRIMRDEEGIVFEAIMNEGLRRLTDLDIATQVANRRRRKVYRQANFGIKEMLGVKDTSSLPPGEKIQYDAGSALLGAIAAIAHHTSMRKAHRSVQTAPDLDSVKRMLMTFETVK